MSQYTTPDEVAIRTAAAHLSALAPAYTARYAAARDLLIRGGWTEDGTVLRFPGGVVVTAGACDCQEGRGPVVCLHEIAYRILAVAAASRAPTVERCDDCGSALTSTTVARIGRTTLTICRPCHYTRIAAGRQRQMEADRSFVARAIGS